MQNTPADHAGPNLPLVSVVIPTHNRRLLLAEAVQSCLDQSYPNVEIIIIDDGSVDGTETFATEQLAGPWAHRAVYHRQRQAGASAARNKGLELARGKYIQFLDSDDILFTKKIALQVEQLEGDASAPEGSACYGRIGVLSQGLRTTRRIGVKCATPHDYVRELCSGILHGMQTSAPLWRTSFLVSRSAWRTDITLGDDLEYYLRLLVEAKRLLFVEQDLFIVREHEGPRLSDARGNRVRTLSAIRTQQAIAEILRNAGMWNASVQGKLLRTARTLYVNILGCGNREDIRGFERWVKELSREPRCVSIPSMLITSRRIFGHRMLLFALRAAIRFTNLRRTLLPLRSA